MEISVGALRNWWNKSSKKQRMLAVLFLVGILATGMLLIISDSPYYRSAGAPAQVVQSQPAGESDGLFSTNPMDPMGSSLYYAGVVIKVVAVLMLIIGCGVVLRRWQTRRGGLLGRQMRVVESIRLSPKQAIHLVKVGDHTVLIGATDQNISMLSEVDFEPLPVAAEITQETGTASASFSDLLRSTAEAKGGQA
jgi:flagellar biosynthetic protein FliO